MNNNYSSRLNENMSSAKEKKHFIYQFVAVVLLKITLKKIQKKALFEINTIQIKMTDFYLRTGIWKFYKMFTFFIL